MRCGSFLAGVLANLMLGLFLLPSSAQATTARDVVVGMKTLPLLYEGGADKAVIALIYDPNSAASKADAEDVLPAFDRGIEAPNGAKYTALLVPVSDLGKISQARAAFLMQGTRGSMDAIYEAANAAHVPTMSSDLSCVQNNKCVLGIVTGGASSVDIYFSKTAADAAKIVFAPAFMMLAKHV